MNDNVSPTATNDCVSPRAIMLALEINRQCDQLLSIIAEMCDNLDSWRSKEDVVY